eukprot:gene2307-2528_t
MVGAVADSSFWSPSPSPSASVSLSDESEDVLLSAMRSLLDYDETDSVLDFAESVVTGASSPTISVCGRDVDSSSESSSNKRARVSYSLPTSLTVEEGQGENAVNLSLRHPDADLVIDASEINRRKRRVRDVPRVIKRDIRRMLFTMFANVGNAADPDLTAKFLEQFALPSCSLLDNIQTKSHSLVLAGVKPILVNGLPTIQAFFSKRVGRCPDYSFTVDRCWISQEKDRPGSRVYAQIRVCGTIMSEDWCQVVDKHKTVHILPSFVAEGLRVVGQLKLVTGGTDHYEKIPATTVMSCVEGYSVFHLDNQHRIYHIEHHGVSHFV